MFVLVFQVQSLYIYFPKPGIYNTEPFRMHRPAQVEAVLKQKKPDPKSKESSNLIATLKCSHTHAHMEAA